MTIKGKKITFSLFNLEKDTPAIFTKLQVGILAIAGSVGAISYGNHSIDGMALSGVLGTILPILFNFFGVEEVEPS